MAERLQQVRDLDRLPVHERQRVHRRGCLRGDAVRFVQPGRHVCRTSADGLDRLHHEHGHSVLDGAVAPRRADGRQCPRRHAELFRVRVADVVPVRSPKVHCRTKLRRRRHTGRGDTRDADQLHLCGRCGRAAARHHGQARCDRRPRDAEGPVPEYRRPGIAVGGAHVPDIQFGRHRYSMGADQRHRRHGQHDCIAATKVLARHHAVPVHAQPGCRHAGQHGARLFPVERHGAELSEHCLLGTPRRRYGQYAAADRNSAHRRRRRADRQLRGRAVRPLGRLLGDERGSGRRLHVLDDQRVLPGAA